MERGTLPTFRLVNIHWKIVNEIIKMNFINKIECQPVLYDKHFPMSYQNFVKMQCGILLWFNE